MKKFLSLLCAVMLVISANAVRVINKEALKAELQTKSKVFVNRAQKEATPTKTLRKAANATSKTLTLNGFVELGESYQQIEAANADTTELVSLIIISDYILGSFTEDDLFSYYSYVLADSAEYEIQTANITVAYNETDSVYNVTGTLACVNYDDESDAVDFTINLTCTGEVPPAPFPSVAKDTVAIDFGEIKNIEYYASDGDYYIYAANANYIATLDLYTDSLPGIYTIDDFYAYYTRLYAINAGDTAQVGSLKDANAVIAETETAYDITAGLYMSDTILYLVHMTYTKPVASDTIYHTFAEPVSLDNYGGDFYFEAVDDSYILTMDYYSTTATGTFALTDMYTKYCGLYNAADSSSIAYADLGLVVTEDETGYDILVNYLAKSSTLYIFTLRADKAVAEDTVQLNLENAEFEDLSEYASYYGFSYYVKAATADSNYVMTFAIISNKMEGTYTVADLVLNYSWIKANGEGAMYVEGEFNVTAGENGSYTLAGEILANDNTLYQFTIKTAETQAIENAEVAGKATKRLVNGQLIIEKNGVLYNVLGSHIK